MKHDPLIGLSENLCDYGIYIFFMGGGDVSAKYIFFLALWVYYVHDLMSLSSRIPFLVFGLLQMVWTGKVEKQFKIYFF